MRRRLAPIAALAAAVAFLAACTWAPTETQIEPDRAVHQHTGDLPTVAVPELQLPFAFQELPTFALPYDDAPQTRAGVLLGLHDAGGVLEFTAVSTAGRILWSTQRPATCSGFTLTVAGQTPIAILTDVGTTGKALAQVSATAYHLHTGEVLWGPVPVAGPWHGPGAVFAEAAPAAEMGATGPRQALDSATGEVLDVPGEVIGEFAGTVLATTDGTLTAHGAHSWQIPLRDLLPQEHPEAGPLPELAAVPGVSTPPGYALIGAVGASEGALVRIADGQVVTVTASSMALDGAAQVLVVKEGDTLAGYTSSGPVWSRGVAAEMRIVTSGGVLTYLRSQDSVQVINAVTGQDAVGYSPETSQYAVPVVITDDGAAVFDLAPFTLVGVHGESGP